MKEENYDDRLDRIVRYFTPILTAGAGGYLFAEGDIKSTIFLGMVTLQLAYENLSEIFPNKRSSNGLEQEVLDR
ncbi:MAG: hypothetical protein AABY03_00335 [Nanoarchaeota archaeon]